MSELDLEALETRARAAVSTSGCDCLVCHYAEDVPALVADVRRLRERADQCEDSFQTFQRDALRVARQRDRLLDENARLSAVVDAARVLRELRARGEDYWRVMGELFDALTALDETETKR